jgi:hypothetical protein
VITITYFRFKVDCRMAELKREAAREGITISEMVESALQQLLLRSQRKRQKMTALPTQAMEGR